MVPAGAVTSVAAQALRAQVVKLLARVRAVSSDPAGKVAPHRLVWRHGEVLTGTATRLWQWSVAPARRSRCRVIAARMDRCWYYTRSDGRQTARASHAGRVVHAGICVRKIENRTDYSAKILEEVGRLRN